MAPPPRELLLLWKVQFSTRRAAPGRRLTTAPPFTEEKLFTKVHPRRVVEEEMLRTAPPELELLPSAKVRSVKVTSAPALIMTIWLVLPPERVTPSCKLEPSTETFWPSISSGLDRVMVFPLKEASKVTVPPGADLSMRSRREPSPESAMFPTTRVRGRSSYAPRSMRWLVLASPSMIRILSSRSVGSEFAALSPASIAGEPA